MQAPVCADPFSLASNMNKSSSSNVCSNIKWCESMVNRRVYSERPVANHEESGRETLKTQASEISRTQCEVYVFPSSRTHAADDTNDLLESVGNREF